MLQQEFIDQTGYTPTESEWKTINEMYMRAGSIDKDTFCKEWLAIHESELFQHFYTQFNNFWIQYDVHKALIKETAELLIRQAEECSEDEMYHQACKMIGQKAVVAYKIDNDYELNKFDKMYIKENLQ